MVLQKRLDYGFVGYQVPPTPRAARSARRRGSFGKTNYDNSMCAFDLLATVAGKLLLEKESSPSSSDTFIKKEPHSEDKSSREEDRLEGSLEKKSLVSQFVSQAPILHHSSKEFFHFHNEDHSGFASVVTTSDCSDKVENTINAKRNILLGSFSSKEEVASPTCQESCDYALDNESKEQIKVEPPKTGKALVSTSGDMYSSDVLEVRNQKPPTLVRVESNVKLPLCNEHTQGGSFPVSSRDDVKLVIRDDDENSSRCTKFGTTMKARPSPRVGDRRIRKLLASKYWKLTPKSKEATHYKADSEIKPAYQSRKNFYKRQRSQRDYPFKKRRLYNYCSASNSDGGIHGDNVFSLPRKGFSFDASESSGKVNGGSGISARVAGQPTPFQSRDSNVKLRIKSFKVPELFVEIPETATVGSLKRTVMEAVTAVLGGGLRVGVILQGKKIRDDNRTLLQTGISHNHDNVLEALGFSLEPNPSQAPSALHHEDCASLLSCDTPQPLKRYPLSPTGVCSVVKSRTIDALSDPPSTTLGNFIESDHDSAPSPPDMSPDKSPMDSRALVAVPAVNAQALSMVPMKKSKRSDAAQRRIRRPFSVSEVEALVQAVEKLGTGRWRDVKLRAFDNAKHRTYVDLKDKWKTLVHTARISPQQRRGEPVPQELLDRVLTAHAYWSQQQAKQQLKQHPETCLLL